jgi:hypothetical protein
LEIADEDRPISSSSVEKFWKTNGVQFKFTVSTNHLTSSKFTINQWWLSASLSYSFYLQDFALTAQTQLPHGHGKLALTNINLKASGHSYFVGLDEIASGKLLSAAKTGTAFSGDRFDYAISEALNVAERLHLFQKQTFERRLLVLPALNFVAVWLHAESDDVIIPLPPTFDRWKAYQPYSEKELLKLLQPEANKALKESNSPR